MLQIKKSEMHLFRTSGWNSTFLFQVQSGLFFELNLLHESILKICDGRTEQEIALELANEFACEDVLKAIGVLAAAELIYDASLEMFSQTQPQYPNVCRLPDSGTSTSQFYITLWQVNAPNFSQGPKTA